jgi:hypothetical protein
MRLLLHSIFSLAAELGRAGLVVDACDFNAEGPLCFSRRPGYRVRQIGKLLRVRDKYFLTILLIGIYWLVRRKVGLALRKLAFAKIAPGSPADTFYFSSP